MAAHLIRSAAILVAVWCLSLAVPCQAALFSGPSAFSQAPFTQLGPLTNNLVLTDNANGFIVTGQVIIAVPPTSTPIAGTLVSWEVDRPLDATFGTSNLFTTTVLDGFSQPPVGLVGTTSGFVASSFTNYPVQSLSQIPISLPNGAATWNNIIVNSSVFTYTSGGVNFLHQRFDVDGVYLAGPGGNWIVDVPVSTFAFEAIAVPEPSTIALLSLGIVGVAIKARRRRIAG